ncbi:phosphoglycolate phosphatase [Roseovarius azorensis]|uniref:Phosphoglycolate phosphatase n=1 Tax=Roseovarius azorensis TaxID=1287727 RepID=A0A1H7NS45_9RHOB|nr:phosphoglycolate phosphatase [Roseovarius azorensis]SEL25805.1 phosphoglycolate phosphatase [Roseovarius azorensis]
MSRAVVFDLDGTLIDSAPDIHASANRLMARHGFAPFEPQETRAFIGRGVPHFIACCLAARGADGSAVLRAQMVEEFVAGYEAAVTLTTIYPGVQDALARLVAMDLRLGICTNKPERPARAVLAHLGLAGHFDVVIGGDSTVQRKPDPMPLQAAVAGLGAGDVVYVGDSEVDAETAERAGLPFALYTEGYRKSPVADLPHHAAFSDFATLPEVVNDLLR